MAKNVTMQTIADAVGVSRVAVSKALSGRAGVSPSTREKILNTARELGYESRISPKDVTKRCTIGVLVMAYQRKPYSMYGGGFGYYSSLFWEVEHAASMQGLGVMARSFQPDSTDDIIPWSDRSDIAGVLAIGPCPTAALAELQKKGIPVVTINHVDYHVPTTSVTTAELIASWQLVDALLQKGHRQIGYIGPTGPEWSYSERWLGYCESLRMAELTPAGCLNAPMGHWFDLQAERTKARFAAMPWREATAYLFADARLVKPVTLWMEELDPDAAGKIECASFYHGPTTYMPPMTVAMMDLGSMAVEAVEQLCQIMSDTSRPPRHVEVYAQIMPSDSAD